MTYITKLSNHLVGEFCEDIVPQDRGKLWLSGVACDMLSPSDEITKNNNKLIMHLKCNIYTKSPIASNWIMQKGHYSESLIFKNYKKK